MVSEGQEAEHGHGAGAERSAAAVTRVQDRPVASDVRNPAFVSSQGPKEPPASLTRHGPCHLLSFFLSLPPFGSSNQNAPCTFPPRSLP